MEFHPVSPAGAIPASCDAGGALSGIVAIRPGDLRFPGSGMSALVAGPDAARPVSGGEVLVFCHPVAAAPAVVRRGGAVQAAGWLPGHVTLGALEAYLPAGEIEELVEDFGCWERRQRLLSSPMAVRLLIAAALIPDGDIPEVIRRVAGLLELLPWARPWHAPGTEALTRRLETIPAELFEALFWQLAGPAAGEDAPGMTWRGFLVCALDGFQVAVPDTDENRAYFGSSGTATTPRRSLILHRWGPDSAGQVERFIVALNFSPYDQTVTTPFSVDGAWHELLANQTVDVSNNALPGVLVTSNWGRIYVNTSPA